MSARILIILPLLICGSWLAVGLLAAPKPTVAPKETPSDLVTELERNYVTWVHRNSVELFVDRPGFGIRRIELPYTDIITAPKPLESKDKGSIIEQEKPKVDSKKPAFDKDSHYAFQDLIQSRASKFPANEQESWSVVKVQLVGLTKNPKPVVYDTAKVPGMKGIKDIPTRELDAFEKLALEALQSGNNLKVHRRGTEMRAMGPIYAGKQCLTCHETPGELLGAFTYVLERRPVKKGK